MNERTKTMLIITLLIGIVSMTVAYANFVSRLTIVSNAKVNASSWSIKFMNLKQKEIESGNTVVINSPARILEGSTIISGLEMVFNKPGDSVTYTFDIVNNGEIDAELNNFVLGTPVCESEPTFCNNIEYTLTYSNGTPIKVGDYLDAGDSKNVTMKIGLSRDLTKMSNTNLDVTNLNAIFDYIQK